MAYPVEDAKRADDTPRSYFAAMPACACARGNSSILRPAKPKNRRARRGSIAPSRADRELLRVALDLQSVHRFGDREPVAVRRIERRHGFVAMKEL